MRVSAMTTPAITYKPRSLFRNPNIRGGYPDPRSAMHHRTPCPGRGPAAALERQIAYRLSGRFHYSG
jgi:hypothetical protein